MSDSKSRQERIEAVAGPHDRDCETNYPLTDPSCDCSRRDRIAAITKLMEDVEREAIENAIAIVQSHEHNEHSADELILSIVRALAESKEGRG